MIVYMLSEYHEYGSHNCIATDDRSKLIGLVDKNWPDAPVWWKDEAKAGIAKLLQKSDDDLVSPDPHDVHGGWGGMQLHVLKLV